MDADCACGSGKSYVECCGPLHSGHRVAVTAEQLMRSRYSAFAVGDADYLLETWDPATRLDSLQLDRAIEWRRLRIRGLTAGTENDDTGTVEFVAHHWDSARRQYGRQHETSRFVRHGSRWFYCGPA